MGTRCRKKIYTCGTHGYIPSLDAEGLLTANSHNAITETSTIHDSFKSPEQSSVRTTGSRKTQLQKQLYDLVSAEVKEECTPKPPPMDYTTTFKGDFSKDFDPRVIPPTKAHDIYTEQPVTFWSNEIEAGTHLSGLSNVTTKDTPFRKNATFSTPIEESLT
ncbi:sperm-associated antigen 8-like isoform X2 [Dysidea avara]|uniref:sperm-associated antigen 8-like isoform X2 n=1 Tax=Dysidea avara TaxID=196820 RepID=UPI003327B2D1